jgi:DNA-binding MarR family transcriptional regulator
MTPRRRDGDQRWDHDCVPRDSVDALLASWRERRPELDFSPVGVVTRLARIRAHLDAELDRLFAAHGLGAASFAVLVTLARLEDEGGVSQRRLMDELGLTSGTISVRMDRLVAEGLVDRRPDPSSGRNTLITLTARGRELFERIVPAHLANERRLLAALSDDEQAVLAALLRKLLVEFEGSRPLGAAPVRLGLTVAPAHVAIAMRASVGLPPVAALLVRAVEDGGPAARAGVRPGDVLVSAGGRELRSVAALYAAIEDAAGAGRLRLRVARGGEERRLTLALGEASRAGGARAVRGEHVV